MRIDRSELMWASGLFEGEGCITVHRKGIPRMQLGSTDVDAVERFHRAIGGIGRVSARNPNIPSRKAHWKPYFEWRIVGHERVQATLAMLWSGLGLRRRLRARTILKAYMARF
jgi:hypothetical protein